MGGVSRKNVTQRLCFMLSNSSGANFLANGSLFGHLGGLPTDEEVLWIVSVIGYIVDSVSVVSSVERFFYERIDGQVRGTLRQAAIDRFSKPG